MKRKKMMNGIWRWRRHVDGVCLPSVYRSGAGVGTYSSGMIVVDEATLPPHRLLTCRFACLLPHTRYALQVALYTHYIPRRCLPAPSHLDSLTPSLLPGTLFSPTWKKTSACLYHFGCHRYTTLPHVYLATFFCSLPATGQVPSHLCTTFIYYYCLLPTLDRTDSSYWVLLPATALPGPACHMVTSLLPCSACLPPSLPSGSLDILCGSAKHGFCWQLHGELRSPHCCCSIRVRALPPSPPATPFNRFPLVVLCLACITAIPRLCHLYLPQPLGYCTHTGLLWHATSYATLPMFLLP